MNSAVCTVFEGHYHYGVVALSNSLYKQGFRGTVYVGYRGELPSWAKEKSIIESIEIWDKAVRFTATEGLQLVFLLLKTNYSLTNYKPDFMQQLWEGPAKNTEALFYFDPDIIINDSWSCFEQWINCGVALCEDVNSPLQEFHPRRVGWRNYFIKSNFELSFKNQIYVNGGFVGLLKKDNAFLALWIKIQESMSDAIGGLDKSIFSKQTYNSTILKTEGFQIFDKSDQDALNASIEVYKGVISYLGKEGMGFISGQPTMYHALGANKPWRINYLLSAIKGIPPRDLDVAYLQNINYPILAHSKMEIKRKEISIKVAKLIGRFYKV